MNRKAAKKPRDAFEQRVLMQRIVFVAAVIVFAVCAFLLIGYGCSSHDRGELNNELRALHGEDGETVIANTPSPVPLEETPLAVTTSPTLTPAPQPTLNAVTPQIYAGSALQTATPSPTLRPWYYNMSGAILGSMSELYARNRDTVGWLSINGLVDLPVVYRDNSYYLNHNFDKQKDNGGTLFLDEKSPLTLQNGKVQHLLIHGHNMKDGSMFGPLVHYKTGNSVSSALSFMKQHAFASFSTLYEKNTYVLWAVAQVSTDYTDMDYVQFAGLGTFVSEDRFYAFTSSIKSKSLYLIEVDVEPCDALLTLSTCIGNDRLLVCYRRVRDGETIDGLNRIINGAISK